MTKAVIAEKQAPEILLFREKLVSDLDTLIHSQEEIISSVDASTVTENFFTTVYKLEIERMKYLLKNYLRTRLFKIQKYYLDIIRNEKGDLLSDAEMSFVTSYFVHKKNHFKESFAARLPKVLADFADAPTTENGDENSNYPVNPEMVTEPNLTKPVFIKITKAVGKLAHQESGISDNLKMGDVMFIPYDRSRALLEANLAELT